MTRSRLTAVLLAAVVLVAATQFFFYFRDNFSTHYPIKAVSAEAFRSGHIPLWNFHAGGGQPLAGNPNTLTFYPDNVLYLVLPAVVAFNLHFLLHLVAAFFAMRALLESRSVSRPNATVAAAIYLLSGTAVTATAFYNLTTAVALIPLALLALESILAKPTIRSSLVFGGSLGLLGLSGEPVTIASAAILLAGFALGRIRLRVLPWFALAAVVAIVVASPLLIAYGEIAGEVTRAFQPYSARTALAASLAPDRLLEIVIGPLHGVLTELGAAGFQPPSSWGPWPPLFGSVFIGAIVLPALFFARRSTRERILAVILAAIALGRFNPVVEAAVSDAPFLRVIRYPEKLAIAITIVLVLAVARWLDETPEAKRDRRAALASAAILVVCCIIAALHAPLLTIARIAAGAVIALAVLAAAAMRQSRRAREAMLILTFTPLAFWAARSIGLDRAHHYTTRPPAAAAIGNARVFRFPDTAPLQLDTPSERNSYRVAAAMFDPLFGASFGARYALDRSPDGMYSWLSRIVVERSTSGDVDRALRYAQLTGCSFVATRLPLEDPRLALVAREMPQGNAFRVYRLNATAPRVLAPSRLYVAGSVQDAVQHVESPTAYDLTEAIVARMKTAAPFAPASIVSVSEGVDTLRIRVRASAQTTIVVNESWFGAWTATAGGASLRTFPANIDRLGVVAPAGESEIVVRFGRRRGLGLAAMIASIALLLAAALAYRRVDTTAPNDTSSPSA